MFYKKVLVLKEIEKNYSLGKKSVSGIARIEVEEGAGEFFLSVINLRPISRGKYFAFILDKNRELFSFELNYNGSIRKPFLGRLDLSDLSIGIVFAEDFIPITVAFADAENSDAKLTEFNGAIAEYFLRLKEKELTAEKSKTPATVARKADEEQNSSPEQPLYDDEVVATENYFEFESIEDKLKLLKEIDDETISLKNELPLSDGKEETQEVLESGRRPQDETDAPLRKEGATDERYFSSVKSELEDIFNKFPPEPDLEKAFFKSRWAKVFYSEKSYYVVGVIFEEDREKYICYGVPGQYSTEPPKELKGYCSFIPLSIFSLHGDGYWMMFQDAQTGECKKPLQ